MDIAEQISKNKNLFLNGLIIVIALFVAVRIYEKQTSELTALKNQRETEEKKNRVLDEVGLVEKKVGELKTAVNSKDPTGALNAIAAIAKENSIKIVSIRPGKETNMPLYKKYPVEVIISADSFHDIGKFISKLESHPDIYFVEKLELRPQVFVQGEARVEKLSATLLVCTILFYG